MTTTDITPPEDGFGLTTASTDQYGVSRDRLLLWQTEGYVTPDATSAADILEKAHLDWGVKLLPLTVPSPDGLTTVTDPKRKVIVRDDTNQPLGVAKSRYVPASNADVLSFLDTLFDSGQALYEAAWEWHGGESVGIAMRIPDEVTIAGVDKYGLYVLARTSNNGGGSVIAAATPVRLACTNMVTIALRAAHRTFRAVHTSSLAGRIAEARSALDLVFNYSSAWDEAAKALLDEPCGDVKVSLTAKALFGEKHEEKAVEFWKNLDNIADYRNTKYGAYNALTEYAQWVRPRNPHLDSAVRGTIAHQTDQAYQLLAA